ncbi:g3329 [Coccomyxa elongata]
MQFVMRIIWGAPQLQRSHRYSRAQRRSNQQQTVLTVLSAEGLNGPPKQGQTELAEDGWISRTLAAFRTSGADIQSVPAPMEEMRVDCLAALRTQRMPTTRNEEYRFTDIAPILQLEPQVAASATVLPGEAIAALVEASPLKEAVARVVVIDGAVASQLSDTERLPQEVFVGSLREAPALPAAQQLGKQARLRGSPFALVNGATAQDVLCIAVPEGVTVESPIHVLYITSGASSVTAPRLLCTLGADACAEVIEEFVGPAKGAEAHFCNAVAEFDLADRAQLLHGYVALEGRRALHMKGTLVRQAAESSYKLTEARLGGRLTRQDINIEQAGEATQTEMGSFLLCGDEQLHDLHSKLRLEHPRGTANQLHKCIVAAGRGRGVFDGAVKVEQKAQKTDAGQLSRNLLLVPRATVNVKPNLQIVADDVKCTHGCAVSDLEESQLFYFRARGVDAAMARKVLVYSFGAEVTGEFAYPELRARIQAAVDRTLANVPILEEPAAEAA